MSTTRRFPFPYVPNTLLAIVDGTVQPITDVDPDDPDGGTFELPADPDDADVRAYARISPGAIPAPPVEEGDGEYEDDFPALEDPEDEYEEDEDVTDAEDDEDEEDDSDAPEYPDD